MVCAEGNGQHLDIYFELPVSRCEGWATMLKVGPRLQQIEIISQGTQGVVLCFVAEGGRSVGLCCTPKSRGQGRGTPQSNSAAALFFFQRNIKEIIGSWILFLTKPSTAPIAEGSSYSARMSRRFTLNADLPTSRNAA